MQRRPRAAQAHPLRRAPLQVLPVRQGVLLSARPARAPAETLGHQTLPLQRVLASLQAERSAGEALEGKLLYLTCFSFNPLFDFSECEF